MKIVLVMVRLITRYYPLKELVCILFVDDHICIAMSMKHGIVMYIS